MGFNWWNKQAGNLILGGRSYLTGKQGLLPDWQIKGQGLNEIFAPKKFREGGEMQRKFVLDRTGAWFGGISGSAGKGGGGGGGTGEPWTDKYNPFKWVDDQKQDVSREYQKRMDDLTRMYEDALKNVPSGGDASKFVKDVIPKPDLSGLGAGVKDGMDNFSTGLAMGLAALGQGVGGGLGDAVPSMQLVNDEGEPNILLIGGLALLAYKVLSGGKK